MIEFDLRALYRSIDAERSGRGLSWSALSRDVGVSTSTIRRFGRADDAEADGVLALVRWLGVAPERFILGSPGGASSPSALLADRRDGGYVRVDMLLVAKASGARNAGGRTRTTIQRLVAAAQQSGQSVASLTRVTDS